MDKRIDEIERVNGGYLMVHLKGGYRLNDDGCHTFGADDSREVKATMRVVQPCCCDDCKRG